ncbi:MAG: permease [Bdellovibrionaceae bacterium]|nr:permease [Pseudobdellovibrionaceae bacterium]
MSSCCPTPQPENTSDCHDHKNTDYILWACLSIVVIAYVFYLSNYFFNDMPHSWLHFSHAVYDLLNKMWWGIALGIFFVGALNLVPRELIISALGRHKGFKGLLRATFLGLLLDLCSHGILMVGMKLYERGASLGQTIAFLVASPWNSFSLTLILISLIGLPWTLLFILGSMVIALISGAIFEELVKRGVLPDQHREDSLPSDFDFKNEIKKLINQTPWNITTLKNIIVDGIKDSQPILKWLFFGIVAAALLQSFVSTEFLKTYFGPSLIGLLLTLTATTVIEVCSEGSTPIAADIFTRAAAPGNAFTFLMAGVATDYTEIMSIKETTRSWKIALFLPLVTVPQVLLLSIIMNS